MEQIHWLVVFSNIAVHYKNNNVRMSVRSHITAVNSGIKLCTENLIKSIKFWYIFYAYMFNPTIVFAYVLGSRINLSLSFLLCNGKA